MRTGSAAERVLDATRSNARDTASAMAASRAAGGGGFGEQPPSAIATTSIAQARGRTRCGRFGTCATRGEASRPMVFLVLCCVSHHTHCGAEAATIPRACIVRGALVLDGWVAVPYNLLAGIGG